MYDERLISAFCQATKRDEIMKLAQMLRQRGIALPEGLMTVNEMAVELCRLK